jgi:hypothetical protein
LKRQAWNDAERSAGGFMQIDPASYVQCAQYDGDQTLAWVEHRLFFTTNPSLYRRSLILEADWPDSEQSEGMFTHLLREDPDARFGYWGRRDDEPWVHHIGVERIGTGY